MKKKTESFFSAFLIAVVFIMAGQCTCCDMVYAAQQGIQAPHEMPQPGCHYHAEEGETKDSSRDCCGKCQGEQFAVLKAASSVSAPEAGKTGHFSALLTDTVSFSSLSFDKFPVLEKNFLPNFSPADSPAAPRAPPFAV